MLIKNKFKGTKVLPDRFLLRFECHLPENPLYTHKAR